MREINLTIIGDRSCSTTRAYLTYLHAAGLRPKRLWLVTFGTQKNKAETRASWISKLVSRFRAKRPSHRGNDAAEHAAFVSLCDKLQGSMPCKVELFQELDWDRYADEIEFFSAVDYNDADLHARIFKHADTAFLYTNGGLVPGEVLHQPDVRVLHIHPGIVPDVRGSDCLYWSYLTRSRFGMSCFYMSPGIDEGDIIGQKEFALPDLSVLKDYLTQDKEPLAYRALLFAFDPHLRAQLLVDVLLNEKSTDVRNLPSTPQLDSSRPAYLWMHPQLRLMTLKRMAA